MSKAVEKPDQANRISWRNLVSVRDLSDILSLVSSVSHLLNQRGQAAVGQMGHGIRESRMLEDVINIVDRLGKIVVRKTREFEHKSVEAIHTVEQEVRESPVVERVESRVRREKPQEAPRKAQSGTGSTGDPGIFVVGAVIGTLLGALLALWFAPHSGEETRQEIEQTAQDVRRRVEGESIQDAIQAGKAEARRLQQTSNTR